MHEATAIWQSLLPLGKSAYISCVSVTKQTYFNVWTSVFVGQLSEQAAEARINLSKISESSSLQIFRDWELILILWKD